MAKTTRKCHFSKCNKDGEISEMIHEEYVDKNGNKKNRYFHPECHTKQQMIGPDLLEQASLDTTIKRIHGVNGAVSPSLWQWIQDVRNGTIRRGSRVVARYKEGIPFCVIEQAWLLAEEQIQWARSNVKFQGKDEKLGELRYSFSIVKDKIPLAYHRWKKNESRKRVVETSDDDSMMKPSMDDIVPTYKKRNDSDDISDFLDD